MHDRIDDQSQPLLRASSLAASQGGLITRRQALAVGVTEAQLRHRLGNQSLLAVHSGIYAFAAAPQTRNQQLFGAVLAAGPAAALSHRCAALLHGTSLFTGTVIEVTVPGRSRPLPPGVIVHRTSSLPPWHLAKVEGLPVTSSARTIVDVASQLGEVRIERLIEEWLADRKVTVAGLHGVLADLGVIGRPNARMVLRLLEQRILRDQPGDSTDDPLLGTVMARHGFPVPVHNYLLDVDHETLEIDWAYVDEQVAVEVEGFSVHTRSRRNFERLLLKRRLLARTPWVLLEYSADMMRTQPSRVAHEVEFCRRQRATGIPA